MTYSHFAWNFLHTTLLKQLSHYLRLFFALISLIYTEIINSDPLHSFFSINLMREFFFLFAGIILSTYLVMKLDINRLKVFDVTFQCYIK